MVLRKIRIFSGVMSGITFWRPLYSEIEAFIWAIECIRILHQFHVTFATDCCQLMKMVSEPKEWSPFANYLEDINTLKEEVSTTQKSFIYPGRKT